MIIRISMTPPSAKVWEDVGLSKIEFAQKEMFSIAEQMRKSAAIVSYLNSYPDHDIKKAIRIHTTEEPRIKEYTKKKRIYSVAYIHITEVTVNKAKLREGESLYIEGLGRDAEPDELFNYRYDRHDNFYLIVDGKEFEEVSTAFDFVDV